jgi:hypothetical protein
MGHNHVDREPHGHRRHAERHFRENDDAQQGRGLAQFSAARTGADDERQCRNGEIGGQSPDPMGPVNRRPVLQGRQVFHAVDGRVAPQGEAFSEIEAGPGLPKAARQVGAGEACEMAAGPSPESQLADQEQQRQPCQPAGPGAGSGRAMCRSDGKKKAVRGHQQGKAEQQMAGHQEGPEAQFQDPEAKHRLRDDDGQAGHGPKHGRNAVPRQRPDQGREDRDHEPHDPRGIAVGLDVDTDLRDIQRRVPGASHRGMQFLPAQFPAEASRPGGTAQAGIRDPHMSAQPDRQQREDHGEHAEKPKHHEQPGAGAR